MKSKLPTEYRPVNGAVDTEKTTRFKLAPPRPEPTPPTDVPAPAAPEQDLQPATSVEQPDSWEPEPLEDWDLPVAAELEAAELETFKLETVEPEIAEPEESQPKHAFESDDTEVLEELASLLQEITPLTEPPVDATAPAATRRQPFGATRR